MDSKIETRWQFGKVHLKAWVFIEKMERDTLNCFWCVYHYSAWEVTAYMQLGKCLISGEVAPLNPLTDEQIGNPVNKSKVLGVQKRIKGHHVNFMVSAFGVFMTLLH